MRNIVLFMMACVTATALWAVPARKGGILKTQPDGSQIMIYQHGDEHFRWLTNEKGEWLKIDKDGYYRVTEALSKEEIATKRMAAPSRAAQEAYAAVPVNIAPRGLIILVNFQDVAFTTSRAEIDSMLIGENYARSYTYIRNGKTHQVESRGSARQYFYDASNGQYIPELDIVGPVTVSQKVAYYGSNKNNFDANPWGMVKEACELVNDSVDFSLYDNNNDGYVDLVFVLYAGYGEADGGAANTIWPHQYWLTATGVTCKVDGKRVDLYACGNEMNNYSKRYTGIGTFCHEFSHVLGLMDYYATEGQTHKTLGSWSLMDDGVYNNDCNTPPTYSAYDRFMLGWLTPELIVEPENIQLEDIKENNRALMISSSDQHNFIGNDPKPTKFYLLENRQQKSWDTHLPGHGLMLTYIQYQSYNWLDNVINNTSNRMGVDLIEADGKTPNSSSIGYNGKAGDLFPFGATQYTKITDHPIEDIEEKNGMIYFKYKGGKIETSTTEVAVDEKIIAIYNILGKQQTTTHIESLPHGTYVVVTPSGNKKIVR